MVRALPCHGRGCEFEPRRPRPQHFLSRDREASKNRLKGRFLLGDNQGIDRSIVMGVYS